MYTSKGKTLYRDGKEIAFIRVYDVGDDAAHALVSDIAESLNTAPKFSGREVSTILAALRWWQFKLTGEAPGDDFADIASNGDTLKPLDDNEVDGLCERINMGYPDEELISTADVIAAAEVFDAGISQQGLLQTLTEEPAVIVLDGAAELTPEYKQLISDTNAALHPGPDMFDLFTQIVVKARTEHKLLLMPEDEEFAQMPLPKEQEERIAAYISAQFLQLFFATKNSLPITMDSETHRLRSDLQAVFRIIASQSKITK